MTRENKLKRKKKHLNDIWNKIDDPPNAITVWKNIKTGQKILLQKDDIFYLVSSENPILRNRRFKSKQAAKKYILRQIRKQQSYSDIVEIK